MQDVSGDSELGAYRSLFSLSVEHAYFADLACRSLVFVPTDATVAWLNKTGLLLKSSESGASVFFDEDRVDALRLHAEDGLKIELKVFSKDPHFSHYTSPSASSDNNVLCFDNNSKQLAEDKTGRQRLHRSNDVTRQAYRSMGSPQLSGVFSQKDYLVKPNFLIQILVAADYPVFAGAAAQQYYIRFATPQTHWKYYLTGDLTRKKVYIADLDNEIKFDDLGNTTLPGDRKAMILQSNTAISMRETHSQRFQLREHGSLGDRVLIKRIPNASICNFNSEIVAKKTEMISEIYIN